MLAKPIISTFDGFLQNESIIIKGIPASRELLEGQVPQLVLVQQGLHKVGLTICDVEEDTVIFEST